jgi:cytochrome c biogenesis protein
VFSKDYPAYLKTLKENKHLTNDYSYYVHNPSVLDPSYAPKGHSTLFVLVPVPTLKAPIDWKTHASVYYEQTYGKAGQWYYWLGLTDTYGSWWFIGLLLMIGTSLVVCSLDRVLPLYRALSKQQIRKHLLFIRRQKITYVTDLPANTVPSEWLEDIKPKFKKQGYRVYHDQTALLAEKNRFSRWGPYINHIGLIIFLMAILLRNIPDWSMDHYIGFVEGEAVQIPNTSYYLKNEQFSVEFYTEDEMTEGFKQQNKLVPKLYETKAVLYECLSDCGNLNKDPVLREVLRHNIHVNKPLQYKGLLAYQFDYALTPQLLSVRPTLINKETKESFGSFQLNMRNPQTSFEAGAYQLELIGYFPDFILNDQGQPATKSNKPLAPAFIFSMKGPDLPAEGSRYLYFPRPVDKEQYGEAQVNTAVGNPMELIIQSMESDVDIANYTSYLNIRTEYALPYILIGAIIFMIGVVMGLYWQHRRIWIRIDEGTLSLGAHTNKNWYGLQVEIDTNLQQMGLHATVMRKD